MTGSRHFDVQTLREFLVFAMRHGGARASRLATQTPGIIELLRPQPTDGDRALQTETIIRHAIRSLGVNQGEKYGKALEFMLCLTPATFGQTLVIRRSKAADLLRVSHHTFRHAYEPALLADLAMEIYETQ